MKTKHLSLCHGSSLLGILLLFSSASNALCQGKLNSFEKDVNSPSEHVSYSDNEDNFKEYDAALLLTWKAASLKTGYRWVNSPNESLDGPYIGISVRL